MRHRHYSQLKAITSLHLPDSLTSEIMRCKTSKCNYTSPLRYFYFDTITRMVANKAEAESSPQDVKLTKAGQQLSLFYELISTDKIVLKQYLSFSNKGNYHLN